jgi:protein-L-isoaspartate O-methyltransferase
MSVRIPAAASSQAPDLTLRERFVRVARLVAESGDLLVARPSDGEAPAPIIARGWDAFLSSLGDPSLEELESRGLAASWADAPESLLALIDELRAVTSFAGSTWNDADPSTRPTRSVRLRESARKRAQVDRMTEVVVPLAMHARRVVDVGAGHGHLTREVASQLGLPVLGLERDPRLADRAKQLGGAGDTSFAVTDVLRDGLSLRSSDCVIGLHACGELGDAIVRSAAEVGASVALVGCCLQKRRQDTRKPLVPTLREDDVQTYVPELPRAILGLSNLSAGDQGVEVSRAENLAGRARRLALRKLLQAHGGDPRPGAEIDGLNRRAAQRDLLSLVERAFSLRKLPLPTRAAIDDAARWAAAQQPLQRRYALPRSMLARALEILVLCDRARHLELSGYEVQIGELFPVQVSARNLALTAWKAGV